MKIIKLFLGVVAVLVVSSAQAQTTINVIQSLPSGGLHEKSTQMIQQALDGAGYKTNLLRFDNCKGLESWVNNNPNKPAIFDYLLGNQALHVADPTHPGACNLLLDSASLVTVLWKSQSQICSLLPPTEAMLLFKSGRGKLGITTSPDIHLEIANQIVSELAPNTKVIRFKGNAPLLQAMTSSDVDFIVQVSNASSAVAAGAQCFLTMGNRSKAAKLKSVSVEDLKQNSSVKDLGHISTIVGYNVDMSKIRPVILEAIKTNPEIKKQVDAGVDLTGIVIGQPADQQWKEVTTYLNKFKK